jgi:hypothetical protein
MKKNKNDIFPALYNLDPDDMYVSGRLEIDTEHGQLKEITADKPIQVRINNGPWVNVRPSDINNK